MALGQVERIVCPHCSLLCDDVFCVINDGKIVSTYNACMRGDAFLKLVNSPNRLTNPLILEEGRLKPAHLSEALDVACNLLSRAKKPLLYGWGSVSYEAQEVGIQLAEKLEGVIDSTSSMCHGISLRLIEEISREEFKCPTLEEVGDMADLVVYWGSNPADSHSRHLSRYTVFPRGKVRITGRLEREVVVVDVIKTRSAKGINLFLQIEPEKDLNLIKALIEYLSGKELPENVGGIMKKDIIDFGKMMKKAQFGTIFFGLGILQQENFKENIEGLIKLVKHPNLKGQFSLMPMIGHSNMLGFNLAAKKMAGVPYGYGIDFSKNPPEKTTVTEALINGDCDAALIIGANPFASFPQKLVEKLQNIPLIVIDTQMNLTVKKASVAIPATITGVETEGTMIRMDMQTKKLRKFLDSPSENCLPDKEILQNLLQKI